MSKKIKLYKFRSLASCEDFCRIRDIIKTGEFHCSNFLDFNDMNEGVFKGKIPDGKSNGKSILEEKLEYKICSFSGINALKKQLMWGHYANAGMGIAIEICVNKADVKKVIYKELELKSNEEWKNRNWIEKFLTHKSAAWSYEHEYRYIKQIKEEEINIGKITKIYFGTPYEKLGNYGDIKKNHTKFQKYLELKECLERFCKEKYPNRKICEDYPFE